MSVSFPQSHEDRTPSPPVKRSRALKDIKRVTFDPVVQETQFEAVNGDTTEIKKPVTLKEAADIVVRCLDPFYKKGKFATKVILDQWFATVGSHVCSE